MALGDRQGALFGSVALHAVAAVAATLTWSAPEAAPVRPIPITLLAEAPAAPSPRPAVPTPAPTPEPAATEAPAPEASPEPTPPPAPAPPTPPRPTPKPIKPEPAVARPKPVEPRQAVAALKPAPAKPKPAAGTPDRPVPAKPQQTAALDLDALQSDLARTRTPVARSSAPRGSTRPAASPTASAGGGSTATLLAGVLGRLQRNWNPNCGVEGADSIRVRVKLTLTPEGGLARQPELLDGQDPRGSSLEDVAAARALRAVNAAAPFSELPSDRYEDWRSFTANFNAKQACASR